MSMKGISPLIATIMLIAFTMAIAGMMSLWANSLVQTQMDQTDNTSASMCTGILNVDAKIYQGKGYAIVEVASSSTSLTGWKGYIQYADPSKNEVVTLSNSTITLRTGDTWTFNFTNSSESPVSIKVSSESCQSASRTVSIYIVG